MEVAFFDEVLVIVVKEIVVTFDVTVDIVEVDNFEDDEREVDWVDEDDEREVDRVDEREVDWVDERVVDRVDESEVDALDVLDETKILVDIVDEAKVVAADVDR